MNDKFLIKSIKDVISRGEKDNCSAEEILLSLNELIPPKVIYRDVEPKSSPEKLEYLKNWREKNKEFEALKKKINSKELIKEQKITQAKKRTTFFCFSCKIPVKVNFGDNKHLIESKRGSIEKKIIVLNKCPYCEGELRAFGGRLSG